MCEKAAVMGNDKLTIDLDDIVNKLWRTDDFEGLPKARFCSYWYLRVASAQERQLDTFTDELSKSFENHDDRNAIVRRIIESFLPCGVHRMQKNK